MEVNSKISPTLHPDNIKGIHGYNDLTAAHCDAAKSTLTLTYKALNDIHKAAAAITSNPLLTAEHQTLKISEFALTKQQHITKNYDATLANLNKFIEVTERSLSTPLVQNAGVGIINEEIRRHVSNMNLDDKVAFLQNALNAKDELTLTAVLGAPHYLTGLPPALHSDLTSKFHKKRNPELVEQLEMYKGSRDLLMRSSKLIFSEVEKAMSFNWAKADRIKAAADKASKALSEIMS
jgi:hypothetical protein